MAKEDMVLDHIAPQVPAFGFDTSPEAVLSACAVVEAATGQTLLPKVCIVSVDRVDDALTLPNWPVLEVLRVQYFDGQGKQHDDEPANFYRTLDGGKTVLRAKPRRMWPNGADRDDAITVTYRAGYDELPPGLRAMVANLL